MNLHTPCDVSLASDEVRYRSAHPTVHKESGGDDPIRTDGAFRGHSALAVRCLRPLGHVSLKPLVGMERFELSRAKALVSKTSVSPISTTSPQLSNFTNLDTLQPTESLSTNSSANGGLPGTRTLKMAQLLRAAQVYLFRQNPIKQKPLDFSRGLAVFKNSTYISRTPLCPANR